MDDRIISEGERWIVWDVLDNAPVASFDSWSHHDPEGRAREVFASYPRRGSLLRERVVKYEREIVEMDAPDASEPAEPSDREPA